MHADFGMMGDMNMGMPFGPMGPMMGGFGMDGFGGPMMGGPMGPMGGGFNMPMGGGFNNMPFGEPLA